MLKEKKWQVRYNCCEDFRTNNEDEKYEKEKRTDEAFKRLKIMNFKSQEQDLFENALRQVIAILPNGNMYELNGNMRLVAKQ